jgi:hypothetical protein
VPVIVFAQLAFVVLFIVKAPLTLNAPGAVTVNVPPVPVKVTDVACLPEVLTVTLNAPMLTVSVATGPPAVHPACQVPAVVQSPLFAAIQPTASALPENKERKKNPKIIRQHIFQANLGSFIRSI